MADLPIEVRDAPMLLIGVESTTLDIVTVKEESEAKERRRRRDLQQQINCLNRRRERELCKSVIDQI